MEFAVWPSDRAHRLLRIIGKGDKQRLVPLPASVLDALGHLWRTHRHPRWLFPSQNRETAVTPNVLSRTFRAAARAAGITQPVTAHSLRHSYATRLPEQGVVTGLRRLLRRLGRGRLGRLGLYRQSRLEQHVTLAQLALQD